MRNLHIDRIYDTFIMKMNSVFAMNTQKIFARFEHRPYSSREIMDFGKYLEDNGGPKVNDSVIYAAYKNNVPIFVPAFSDCSAGFGIMFTRLITLIHMYRSISGKDFLETDSVKLNSKETGIFMIGGGVPKNLHRI